MIDFHFCATPNGMKVALMLEETGLDHRVIHYDIFEGDHLTPAFGLINPNRKLPAIVDQAPADGGEPLAVFESGAVLQYLAEKTWQFLPRDLRGRTRAIAWLQWQMASLGPMGGQASHFQRYAPEGNDYALQRYSNELDRLLIVLETRLAEAPYLAGEDYSIADMAVWPGRNSMFTIMGRNLDLYPAMADWVARIRERPAVQRALARPELKAPDKYIQRRAVLSAREWSNIFGEKMLAAVRPVRS